MKVAITGCGGIANAAHIPAYMKNPEAEIVYFCDIIPERAEEAVEKYGCGKAVVDYKEVPADPEIEAVSVCPPTTFTPLLRWTRCARGKKYCAKNCPLTSIRSSSRRR